MSTRAYDFTLTLTGGNLDNYFKDNVVVGSSTATEGRIISVDKANSQIKVKVANSLHSFSSGESVSIQSVVTTGGNTKLTFGDLNFSTPQYSSTTSSSSRSISSIDLGGFSTFKNAVEQSPIVRLLSIYYPGEFYPPNKNDNPSNAGEGLAWPVGFPYYFASVQGDVLSDLEYRAYHDGEEYLVYPINFGGTDISTDGRVNQTTVEISNFDNLIASIVEDPYISGNNTSNSVYATVGGQIVANIDPRTVPGTTSNPDGLNYDQTVVDGIYAGVSNSAFTYAQTQVVNGTWKQSKQDSRDLLGGVVKVKTTFSSCLDYWPEYSTVRDSRANVVEVYSSLPYRVGDNVIVSGSSTKHSIVKEVRGNFLQLENSISTVIGDKLFIVNPSRDPHAYVEDVFRIESLAGLNSLSATFSLTNWLEYFKFVLPKRKFYKNTCQWIYKGEECQYPEDGTGTIPGYPTGKTKTANGFFTINNATTLDQSEDVCAKNYEACSLRNNQVHFGGFIATGRTIPK